MRLTPHHAFLVRQLLALGARIRDAVLASRRRAPERLRGSRGQGPGDTIYGVDRVAEAVLVEFLEREVAPRLPCVVTAEGLGATGTRVFPAGLAEDRAPVRLLIDPIDGSRVLMYDKRSAWVLAAAAPNRGPDTTLRDVEVAVQVEIPTVKQTRADLLWAVRGRGARARRVDLATGRACAWTPRPSRARTPRGGFAAIARLFPGARGLLGELDDELMRRVAGPEREGKALVFEDQYLSNGGQLYELVAGHDRFVADLRAVLRRARVPGAPGLAPHPYDLCTELIAREAGAVVVDARGRPLRAPFAVDHDVDFVGYANPALRRAMEPALHAVLRKRGLM